MQIACQNTGMRCLGVSSKSSSSVNKPCKDKLVSIMHKLTFRMIGRCNWHAVKQQSNREGKKGNCFESEGELGTFSSAGKRG